MLEALKEQVWKANLELAEKGVVIYTWGNVSGISEDRKYVVIKPSGISYEAMAAEDMVVVSLENGNVVEGKWKPSSDTPTHLALYRRYPAVGGVAHTHSVHATAFAQAGLPISALGTTHADYFYGSVPCTRDLTEAEVADAYEENTGKVITETVMQAPMEVPGCLVKGHGPFTWGKSPAEAVYHAVALEEVAQMALLTMQLNPKTVLPRYMLDKHFLRKHGKNAYYGQK